MKSFLLFIFCFCLFSTVNGQIEPLLEYDQSVFKINPSKAIVHIDFYKTGKGKPIFIGDSNERIWLKLTNNSIWSIRLGVFNGDKNEYYLYYKVEMENNEIDNKDKPEGYLRGHFGSPDSELESGKSIIFSIPQNHLAENLKIKVNYTIKIDKNSFGVSEFPTSAYYLHSDFKKTTKNKPIDY